jgi:hypothetical protein
MGCQTAIAAHILDQGGDDLLALKSNHKKAYTPRSRAVYNPLIFQGNL